MPHSFQLRRSLPEIDQPNAFHTVFEEKSRPKALEPSVTVGYLQAILTIIIKLDFSFEEA
jgi:hypothetical protein